MTYTRAFALAAALLAASCSAPEQANNSNLMGNFEDLPNNLVVPPDESADSLTDNASAADEVIANNTIAPEVTNGLK